MRYVRTNNDKIIDTQTEKKSWHEQNEYFVLHENELVERYPIEYGEGSMLCVRYEYRKIGIIKKEANSIGELCDKFCMIDTESEYPVFDSLENLTNTRKTYYRARPFYKINGRYKNIYGGIFTDKGFLYIARANFEGELELL